MKQHLFLLLLSILSLNAFAQKRFIEIDGNKIWINTIGLEDREAGKPVVVFESGHGTPMDNWDRVLDGVSEFSPLVTYDRPGVGQSAAIEEMPTLKNVADRMVKILAHLELEPPYLLVGHSLGGVYVRGFAIYYPELLAGLVIVDPGDFTETSENIRDHYAVLNWEPTRVDSLIQSFIDVRKNRRKDAPPAIRREGMVLAELREKDFKEIIDSPLPNIPVHIITSGRFDKPKHLQTTLYDEEALFRSKMKHRMARWTDVVQSVDRGMLFYSGDAGHFVQWDDPELVVSSIKIALKDYKEMTASENAAEE